MYLKAANALCWPDKALRCLYLPKGCKLPTLHKYYHDHVPFPSCHRLGCRKYAKISIRLLSWFGFVGPTRQFLFWDDILFFAVPPSKSAPSWVATVLKSPEEKEELITTKLLRKVLHLVPQFSARDWGHLRPQQSSCLGDQSRCGASRSSVFRQGLLSTTSFPASAVPVFYSPSSI